MIDDLCIDIDECKTAEICEENEQCENLFGSFMCVCAAGFVRNNQSEICDDIDECEEGTAECGANSSCENTIGAYDCPCNSGFEDVDGSCQGKILFPPT